MTADAWMNRAFEEKRKLMGFGHRVYKNGDHRARIGGGVRRSDRSRQKVVRPRGRGS